MILLGAIFAAVGIYISTSVRLVGSIGYVFAGLGVVFVLVGGAWLIVRQRQPRLASGTTAWPTDPRMYAGTTLAWLPGRATVTAAREAGQAPDGQPVYELDLQVQLVGMTPYPVRQRVPVPPRAAGRISPGSSVPVQASAQDPSQLLIDWAAP